MCFSAGRGEHNVTAPLDNPKTLHYVKVDQRKVTKFALMWQWVKKKFSENLKSLGAVKSVETVTLSFCQILKNCKIFSILPISTLN